MLTTKQKNHPRLSNNFSLSLFLFPLSLSLIHPLYLILPHSLILFLVFPIFLHFPCLVSHIFTASLSLPLSIYLSNSPKFCLFLSLLNSFYLSISLIHSTLFLFLSLSSLSVSAVLAVYFPPS